MARRRVEQRRFGRIVMAYLRTPQPHPLRQCRPRGIELVEVVQFLEQRVVHERRVRVRIGDAKRGLPQAGDVVVRRRHASYSRRAVSTFPA